MKPRGVELKEEMEGGGARWEDSSRSLVDLCRRGVPETFHPRLQKRGEKRKMGCMRPSLCLEGGEKVTTHSLLPLLPFLHLSLTLPASSSESYKCELESSSFS